MEINVLPSLIVIILLVVLGMVAALALYLRWQGSIKPAPYDVMFEVRESEALRVKREPDGWRVIADDGAVPAALRTGTTPDALDTRHELVPVDGGYRAASEIHPHQRYFFEIELHDGQTIRTAE